MEGKKKENVEWVKGMVGCLWRREEASGAMWMAHWFPGMESNMENPLDEMWEAELASSLDAGQRRPGLTEETKWRQSGFFAKGMNMIQKSLRGVAVAAMACGTGRLHQGYSQELAEAVQPQGENLDQTVPVWHRDSKKQIQEMS